MTLPICIIAALVIAVACGVTGIVLTQRPYQIRPVRIVGIVELVTNGRFYDRYVAYKYNNRRHRVKLPDDPAYDKLNAKHMVKIALRPDRPNDIRIINHPEKNPPAAICFIAAISLAALSLVLTAALFISR